MSFREIVNCIDGDGENDRTLEMARYPWSKQ